MKNQDCVTVAGVGLYSKNIEAAVSQLLTSIVEDSSKKNLCVSATGAHGIVNTKKDRVFKKILDDFYINLPDGMPGVWVGRLKGAKEMRRCYGPDFFAELMKASADKNVKHFLCGGKEGVAEKLKKACNDTFKNTNIAGIYCPPFLSVEEYDYEEIAKNINRVGADIVWVGISTPKQEKFAHYLSRHTHVHFLITVGAAFDFHIGTVKQAPAWMQQAGLEWFFRLSVEPKRLYKRYLEIVPKFLFYATADLLSYNIKKLKNPS